MRLSPTDRRALAARAASIYERQAAGVVSPAASEGDRRRVQQWQQAFAPGDPEAFARRLAWDGFDPATVGQMLAAAPQDGISTDRTDNWLMWLDLVCAEAAGVHADALAGRIHHGQDDDAQPFEEVLRLVTRAGRRAIEARVPPAAMARVTLGAFEAFERQLARECGRYLDLALYEQFRASNLRYDAFIAHLLDGGLIGVFQEYAALARQLATVLAGWTGATAELLLRLDTDRDAITSTFAGGVDPGPVTRVDAALSDPHHGRRRVCAIGFASGLRLVYKPRGVAIERAFGDLVSWVNERLEHPLRRLAVVDRERYGWVEFAAHEPLADRAEAAGWFYRAGALMGVTAVLGARDLHRDNVVATRQGPVLVDLELLLQPAGSLSAAALADRAPQDVRPPAPAPCLSTGMLSLIDLTAEGEPYDVGGLRGARTGSLPFPARVWRGCGTDALHPIEHTTFAAAGSHQVRVGDLVLEPGDHADDLAAGYSDAYGTLLARRADLLRPGGPLDAFAPCTIRVLPRPTNQYAMLAHVLATPKYQRDGVAPSVAVDVLHRGFGPSRSRPALWPMVLEERRALWSLDIPYFGMRADAVDASADGRTLIAGCFTRSGLDAARARIAALDAADLAAQVALLRRALSESVTARYLPGDRDDQRTVAPPDRFVEAAELIAEALLSRAVRAGAGLCWRYRPAAGGPGWRDHHLYDGSLGPGLFFTALAAVTGKARWAEIARQAMEPVRAHADRWPAGALAAGEPVGAGNGLGSVVYGLTAVAAIGGDRAWLALANDLARVIPSHLIADGPTDITDGSAGAALALLALYDATGEARVLAAARSCGLHLLAREVRVGPAASAWPSDSGTRLLGFAHGTSGVAAALARLFGATGDPAFAHAARRAYRFVRDRHLDQAGNWPIAADSHGGPIGGSMNGWCHGAPGITMSAMVAARVRPAAAVTHAIESAARHLAQDQPSQADHLCCGVLGRADVLLARGTWFDRGEAVAAARAMALAVVERAGRRGHFRLSGAGTDYRVFDPGFFQGLSGIGYVLLRMVQPEALPAVGAFDAPRSSLRYCSPVAGTVSRVGRPPAARTVSAEFTS